LNGGRIARFTVKDWELLIPYLKENERLFGISVEEVLLRKDGSSCEPWQIYKKVEVVPLSALSNGDKLFADE
jgi:hypothetical protein